MADPLAVTLTVDQLREVVRDEVRRVLREQAGALPERALLDRKGLAHALGVSAPTVDRLRRLPGFPEVRVAQAARFELHAVLAFLRGRRPMLAVVK